MADEPMNGLPWEHIDALEDQAVAAIQEANDNARLWAMDEAEDDDNGNLAPEGGVIVQRALRMAEHAMRALDMVQNRMEEDLLMLEGLRPRHQHRLGRDDDEDDDDMLLEEDGEVD